MYCIKWSRIFRSDKNWNLIVIDLGDGIEVIEIPFSRLVQYWKTVNHFNDLNKKYKPFVKRLGPFQITFDNPKYKCYGLFDQYCGKEKMIGGTQLMEWEPNTIRFRTINIIKEYRHQDLGWCLLEAAYKEDWQDYENLFGWMKIDKLDWALSKGFNIIKGSEQDNHVGIMRKM